MSNQETMTIAWDDWSFYDGSRTEGGSNSRSDQYGDNGASVDEVVPLDLFPINPAHESYVRRLDSLGLPRSHSQFREHEKVEGIQWLKMGTMVVFYPSDAKMKQVVRIPYFSTLQLAGSRNLRIRVSRSNGKAFEEVAIEQVTRLYIGQTSPSFAKSTCSNSLSLFSFSIGYTDFSGQPRCLDFVATSDHIFCLWTSTIRMLLSELKSSDIKRSNVALGDGRPLSPVSGTPLSSRKSTFFRPKPVTWTPYMAKLESILYHRPVQDIQFTPHICRCLSLDQDRVPQTPNEPTISSERFSDDSASESETSRSSLSKQAFHPPAPRTPKNTTAYGTRPKVITDKLVNSGRPSGPRSDFSPNDPNTSSPPTTSSPPERGSPHPSSENPDKIGPIPSSRDMSNPIPLGREKSSPNTTNSPSLLAAALVARGSTPRMSDGTPPPPDSPLFEKPDSPKPAVPQSPSAIDLLQRRGRLAKKRPQALNKSEIIQATSAATDWGAELPPVTPLPGTLQRTSPPLVAQRTASDARGRPPPMMMMRRDNSWNSQSLRDVHDIHEPQTARPTNAHAVTASPQTAKIPLNQGARSRMKGQLTLGQEIQPAPHPNSESWKHEPMTAPVQRRTSAPPVGAASLRNGREEAKVPGLKLLRCEDHVGNSIANKFGEHANVDLVKALRHGGKVITVEEAPSVCMMQLVQQNGDVQLWITKPNEILRVSLLQIEEIRFGQNSPGFEEFGPRKLAAYSFSLLCLHVDENDQNEEEAKYWLDIVATTQRQFELWTEGLVQLVGLLRKWIQDSPGHHFLKMVLSLPAENPTEVNITDVARKYFAEAKESKLSKVRKGLNRLLFNKQ
jgi:hypothetical protein